MLSSLFFLQVLISASCSIDDGLSDLLHRLAGYPSKSDRALHKRPVETIEAMLSGFDICSHHHLVAVGCVVGFAAVVTAPPEWHVVAQGSGSDG